MRVVEKFLKVLLPQIATRQVYVFVCMFVCVLMCAHVSIGVYL